MSFYDFFHKFFKDFQADDFRPPRNEEQDEFNNSRDDPFQFPDNRNDTREFRSHFSAMRDLFELQKRLEEEFSEAFKIFSNTDQFFGFHGPGRSVPAIEGTDPRDEYLKPEYRNEYQPKTDKFEDKLDQKSKSLSSWLDSMGPGHSSFSSVTIKTVRLPDGTVKTYKTIRNPDGSEKTTESQTLPDGNSSANFDSPFMDPGFFNLPRMPKINSIDPRDELLKPGFEQPRPFEEKADKDLDRHILQSGINSLPSFSTDDTIVRPSQQSTFKSFVKTTVTLPNGVVETKEVVRNSDGTEHRTVTQVFPDGTTKVIPTPFTGSQIVPGSERTSDSDTSFTLKGLKDIIDSLFK